MRAFLLTSLLLAAAPLAAAQEGEGSFGADGFFDPDSEPTTDAMRRPSPAMPPSWCTRAPEVWNSTAPPRRGTEAMWHSPSQPSCM